VFTKPGFLLRLEGGLDLALSLIFYQAIHANWLLFVVLLLVPDLSMLGYLRGARLGTICYNLVHTLIGPFLLIVYAYLTRSLWVLPYALIWTAHIGLDRVLGFGLKYPTGFRDTHLGGKTNDKWQIEELQEFKAAPASLREALRAGVREFAIVAISLFSALGGRDLSSVICHGASPKSGSFRQLLPA
jgi:hypothetical protein